MASFVEKGFGARIEITDRSANWYEAAGERNDQSVLFLVHAYCQGDAKDIVDRHNEQRKQEATFLREPPSDLIENLKPITIADVAEKLAKGTNAVLIVTEDGRNSTESGISPGMRDFIQKAGQPKKDVRANADGPPRDPS